MITRRLQTQLCVAVIRINPDGTASLRRKRYSSYTGARRALTRYYGEAFEIK